MAENTKIEWADRTFNPWRGCTKISDACDFCYAETLVTGRLQEDVWGNKPRKLAAESTWKAPLRWQRQADAFEAAHGRPQFIFCASLADVFDNQVDPAWRDRLWDLIRSCDRLIWLLLTKRPQNIHKMLPADWGNGWPHVWLGTTVEHQEAADRNVPALLSIPAAKRFLSCEPLLGPLDVSKWMWPVCKWWNVHAKSYEHAKAEGLPHGQRRQGLVSSHARFIDWVIAGGESGPNSRPSNPQWFRDLRDQCAAAGTPFMFKQWGDWVSVSEVAGEGPHHEFPDDRRVRRIGKVAAGRTLDGVTHDGRPLP